MGNFQFEAAGDEFAAIPEASGRFHGHDINGGCYYSDGPSYDVVDFGETHI
jgi:hypothetical protein